jgi:hypothetical protein
MTAPNNPNVDPSTDRTHKFTDDVKSAFRGIRGAGDAIRGTAMEAVDTAADSKEGEARNHALAQKGVNDMEGADQRFGQRREEHHTVGPAAGTAGQHAVTGNTATTGIGAGSGAVTGSDAHAGTVPGQMPPARQGTEGRAQNQHLQQHTQQHQLGHGTGASNV